MTILIIIIVVGLLMSGLVFWGVHQEQKTKLSNVPLKRSGPSENQPAYGHSFNPIMAVKNRLPTLPAGYMWEIFIRDRTTPPNFFLIGDHKGQEIVVNLFRMSDSKVVASNAIVISWYEDHAKTFSQHYAEYGKYGIAKESAYKTFVYPMVGWAKDRMMDMTGPEVHGYTTST